MIIKKCPAHYENLGCMCNTMTFKACEEQDNCIMKQVLKIVGNNQEINKLLEVEE